MDFITAKHMTESKAGTETVWELVPELMDKEGTCYSRFIPSIFKKLDNLLCLLLPQTEQ